MRGIYLKDNNNNKCLVAPYYRVGDLFLTTNATNPSNYLGGKWELFGPGRVLVCVDTSNTNFNTVKKTGGAATHTHTQGATGAASGNTGAASGNTGSTTLTAAQSGLPSHGHTYEKFTYTTSGTDWGCKNSSSWGDTMVNVANTTGTSGGTKASQGHTHTLNSHTHTLNSHTHTNPTTAATSSLQPFITCYVWIRTA